MLDDTTLLTRNGLTDLQDVAEIEFTAANLGETLSKINRYVGRTPEPWSVAVHSVLVSRLCREPRAAACGLLHDAHEAFIGDMITPAISFIASQSQPMGSQIVRNCVREAKRRLDVQIADAWDVHFADYVQDVRHADDAALYAEMFTFFDSVTVPVHLEDDVERALEFMRGLPNGGNWRTACDLWINEAQLLADMAALRLPRVES